MLSPSAVSLLRHLSVSPGLGSASNSKLADIINRCPRSVNRGLRELVDRGAVTVTYSRTEGPGEVGRQIAVVTETAESILNPVEETPNGA